MGGLCFDWIVYACNMLTDLEFCLIRQWYCPEMPEWNMEKYRFYVDLPGEMFDALHLYVCVAVLRC